MGTSECSVYIRHIFCIYSTADNSAVKRPLPDVGEMFRGAHILSVISMRFAKRIYPYSFGKILHNQQKSEKNSINSIESRYIDKNNTDMQN